MNAKAKQRPNVLIETPSRWISGFICGGEYGSGFILAPLLIDPF
jgi:hypothetical protein